MIELDGSSHDSDKGVLRDAARERWLVSLGIRVLRFENRHVINNMQGVLENIEQVFSRQSDGESTTLIASRVTTPAASGDPSSDEEGNVG